MFEVTRGVGQIGARALARGLGSVYGDIARVGENIRTKMKKAADELDEFLDDARDGGYEGDPEEPRGVNDRRSNRPGPPGHRR
jgi:hypothetical protein